MKTNIIILIILVTVACIFNSCKSDSSTESSGELVADETYFPAGEGTSYKYNVNRVDAENNQSTGTRSSVYSGTMGIYQIQIDSLIFPELTTVDSAFFRKTGTGIFFFLDTTGLYTSIPDSLLPSLTFDEEMRSFLFPMYDQSNWPVFKMALTVQGFTFYPVEVNASYAGKENLSLNLIDGTENVDAVKVMFRLSIKTNPLGSAANYDAFAWLAKDKGIVKWQGCGTIVNAFTGGGIVFDDTTSTVSQDIIEYNIN
jgi:hypothetical protein